MGKKNKNKSKLLTGSAVPLNNDESIPRDSLELPHANDESSAPEDSETSHTPNDTTGDDSGTQEAVVINPDIPAEKAVADAPKSETTPGPEPESDAEPVAESTPTETEPANKSNDSAPPPPKTKKRLTLQERLALAAKGNKKTAKSGAPKVPTPVVGSPVRSVSPEPPAIIDSSENETKETSHESELLRLKALNAELMEENRKLKLGSSSTNFEKERKDLVAKLNTKEETIKQLLKEGESLSIKELKLNEVIKTLKSTNLELETLVKDYSTKSDVSLIKINELEDFLRTHKFKSIEQLLENYTELNRKYTNLESDLKREKNLNWQGKYKEQQRLYENELNDKKAALKDLNETKIQLDMYKSQAALDLNSKDNIISSLKKNISDLKEEFSQESARLESKLEFLRVEHESSSYVKKDAGHNHENEISSNKSNGGNTSKVSDSKVIDYEEFAKLSQTHHNLQQQYVSSQENWKLIESNLLNKVDNLSSSVESLKKSKLKLSNDVKKLNNDLANESKDFEDLNEKHSNLLKEYKELQFQLKIKDNEIQESQEKFDKLKQIFNTDRQNLESKIKTLTENLDKLKNDSFLNEDTNYSFTKSSPQLKKINESGLHINIDPPARLQFRSPSIESATNNFGNSWPDIKLGESSTTPAITKEFSGVFLSRSNNNSSSSFQENTDDDISLQDDYSFQSKYQTSNKNLASGGSSYTISHSNLQSSNSLSGLIPTSTGTSNIQLINKMSSNIRRLEIELNTLKEENSILALEKDQAQQEILSKFELSNEIEQLQNQIKQLENQIDEKSIKEQTMLELIGEKSEQVEELRADVEDLKDLCKQQVQQMIELQEAKIANS